jgi:type I restriction enzyme R subunit
VLDFANKQEEIQKAFQPYYDRTILTEGTDPNLLHDLQDELADFHFYGTDDVERFASIYFDPKFTQDKLFAALEPVLDRYKAAEDEDQRKAFRKAFTDYTRLYAFLSQIITFTDAELEKLYVFGRLLLRRLPVQREELPVEIQKNIDMDSYQIKPTASGKIGLKRGVGELEPQKGGGDNIPPEPPFPEPLSQIIQELNERFGTDFTADDKVFIEHLEGKLATDQALEASVKVNTPENARLTFDHVANDKVQELIDTNFKFYKQINDDPEFGKFLLDWLFERYNRKKSA